MSNKCIEVSKNLTYFIFITFQQVFQYKSFLFSLFFCVVSMTKTTQKPTFTYFIINTFIKLFHWIGNYSPYSITFYFSIQMIKVKSTTFFFLFRSHSSHFPFFNFMVFTYFFLIIVTRLGLFFLCS